MADATASNPNDGDDVLKWLGQMVPGSLSDVLLQAVLEVERVGPYQKLLLDAIDARFPRLDHTDTHHERHPNYLGA